MMYVNTEEITGYEISEMLGVVRGSSVRAKWLGADFVAAIRNVFGGEITEYSKLLAEAREQAIDRMMEDAKELGADAIVNVRFMTSQVGQQAAEILVYGTAVKTNKKA
ncbi:MAG: heavy metal-binding domain-containing protein [Candidatus Altiarchaeales archaeon]|nr:heavy metal-binding domain-containing protein [Candidatus Altiarchaeales archaeon]MBD3416021.1 heavy metal-binding domain-containing protein [Candidatus Altiarchaeales archaeon]